MLKFNIHAGFYHRKLSHEQVFKASPLPHGLKTKFAATVALVLLCCLSYQTVSAQCSPDITAPTAICKGPFTIALNTNGNAPITPADIDNGSFDNCGAVQLTVAPSNVNCSSIGVVSVILFVTDLAGNTNNCTTNVTVVDNLPPAIICPAPYTFNTCPANTTPAVTGFASAIDNCGGNLAQKAYCTLPGNGITYCDVANGCTGNGIARTWTATYNGLSASCVQNIVVNDTQAPVVDWNGASPGLGSGPANVTVTCIAGPPAALAYPNPPSITVTDNCDVSVTNTVTDVSTKSADPNSCANTSYTVTRTYKSQDDCGNVTTYVQVITVTNTAPVVTPPAAINLPAGSNCKATVSAALATATVSDCTPNAQLLLAFTVRNTVNNQIVFSGNGLNASGVFDAGTYLITYSAIDPCGLITNATTTMNIVDNVSPTAICVAGSIQVSIPPTGTTSLTAAQVNNGSFDNCTPISGLTYSITGATFTCADVGGIFPDIVVLTVTDANGNSNSCTSSVNVVNNSPPAVICKNLTVQLDGSGNVNVLASALDNGSTDACDSPAPLGFAFVELNSSVIAPANSLTFNCVQVGVNTVKVRVREVDNGQIPVFTNDGFCTQTITVQDVTPPTAVCNNITIPLDEDGMVSLSDEASLSFTSTPATPIFDLATATTTINTAPANATIADLNITLDISHSFLNDLRVTLTSPQGTTITLFDDAGCGGDNLLAEFDDQAVANYAAFTASCDNSGSPEISGVFHPLNNLSAFNGQNLNGVWTLTVIDEVGGDAGTLNSWTLDFTSNYLNLLGSSSSDNCSVTWNATPTTFNCSDVGDQDLGTPGIQGNPYVLTATDPSGNTATCTGIITVVDPIAPVVSCAPITVSTGLVNPQTGISTPGLVTVFPGDVVTGGLYLSTSNNGSGTVGSNNFQVVVPNVMTFTFDWEYESHDNSAADDVFGYYIGNTFTQLTSNVGSLSQSGTATVSVAAGATFGFRAQTADNLGGDAEIWITDFSPFFKGAFKASNWAQSSTNSNGKQFFYDACGVQNWSISKDGGANYLSSVSFNCADIAALPNPESIIIRATDLSGNQTTCATTVTVVDNEAPQAQCQPLLVSLNSGGNATVLATDVNFGSSDACCPAPLVYAISKDNGVTFNPSTSFTCANIGVNNVILKVTDCATVPNSAYCQTTVTIKDQLPPAITCPANVTVNCDQSSAPTATGFATATDNCSTPTVTWENTNAVPANTPNCQVITRKWTATDNATPANVSVCFQTITVQDLVAPSLDWNGASAGLGTAPTSPLAADACSVPAAATPAGVDNCATPTPSFNQTSTQGNNPANSNYYNYTITRTWAVSDNCGNSSSYVQTVNVSDSNAPVFSFPAPAPVANFTFNNNPGNCAGTANISLLNYITDCALDQYLAVTYQIDGGAVQTGSTVNAVLSAGSHTIIVTADDPSTVTGVVSVSITVLIRDTESPTAVCQTGPISVTLNSNGIANITPATVNNGSNDNCGITSLNVNPASFDCFTTPNPHTVTLTVTDAAGNFNTCTTTVQITNASAPTIQCPIAATVSCSVFVANNPATSGGSATAMTACGPVATTYTDVIASGSGNCKVINRTWSATTAGGTATCLQVITVTDNVPAVLVGVPANATAQACAVPTAATVTATDNCATPAVSFAQTSTQGADQALCSYYNYTVTRNWSTTDGCQANPTTGTQTITVSDNTAPLMAVPNPLIIGTDPNTCQATLNVDLKNYISDCAADPYLTVTRTAAAPIGNGSNVITGVYATGNYTITVTATDPCGNSASQTFILSIRDLQAPQAACLPGVTLILDSNGNGSLTPADIDNGSLDNCGSINLSISPSTFNVSNVGVVPVVLTVTDNASPANSSQCTTPVTVIQRGTISAGNVQGGVGSNVSIPVSVTGFDNVCALSFSMHLAGPAGSVTGVGGFNLPGMSSADFNVVGNNITFSWVSGSPVTVSDGTAIFNVNVSLTGPVGSVSTLTINGTPTSVMMARCNSTVIPVTTINGSATVVLVPSNITLSGNIQREAPGGNVELVNVGMTGTTNGTQTTGASGTYSFTVASGSNETITPVKDINDCNGINVLDVLILQQHVLGTTPLSTPYRRIAADVNNDGLINVLDRLELHLIVLAGTPCIGLANNTSWRFVDAAYVFPDPLNPFSPPYPQNKIYTNVTTNQTGNFIGVKIGDLDLSANPANIVGGPVSDGGEGTMLFNIDEQTIHAGNEYRVDFRAKDFFNYAAYQYTLDFDASVLKFKQVEMGALPNLGSQNFGVADADNGTITSIWYNSDATTIADDEVLFTMVFDAVGDADKLSGLLHILSNPVVSEAYTGDLAKQGIGITYSNSVSGVNDVHAGKMSLYQNRPNPFSSATVIPFYLPSSTHATMTISDISGKTVKVMEGDFSAGNHSFQVSKSELPSTGVFFYRLETENGIAVKKMILMD